jgi:hypothetical protein
VNSSKSSLVNLKSINKNYRSTELDFDIADEVVQDLIIKNKRLLSLSTETRGKNKITRLGELEKELKTMKINNQDWVVLHSSFTPDLVIQ